MGSANPAGDGGEPSGKEAADRERERERVRVAAESNIRLFTLALRTYVHAMQAPISYVRGRTAGCVRCCLRALPSCVRACVRAVSMYVRVRATYMRTQSRKLLYS